MTANVLSGSYYEITFWNGNSTDEEDVLSVLRYDNTYENLISTSTNAMTVQVKNSRRSATLLMLITVQKGIYFIAHLR